MPSSNLPLTGERTVPPSPTTWHEAYWFHRHVAGYLALRPWLPPRGTVLDAGCGEGYAAPLLRGLGAGRVVLADYDGPALAHARSTYGRSGCPASVAALRTNLVALPLADSSVEVVTNLQVIEHLWTPHQFLAESARVLVPGGRLLLTTPNRLTFSPGLERDAKPLNPFHVKEYDADQLVAEVAEHLEVQAVLGLQHGPRLARWEAQHGLLVDAQLAAPADAWDRGVADLVRSVTADDFVLTGDVDRSLDLLVVAGAP